MLNYDPGLAMKVLKILPENFNIFVLVLNNHRLSIWCGTYGERREKILRNKTVERLEKEWNEADQRLMKEKLNGY